MGISKINRQKMGVNLLRMFISNSTLSKWVT
jgi:hypothetical protein